MKKIEEMPISKLEEIASAGKVNVPPDLESHIEELTDGLEAVRKLTGTDRKKPLLWSGIAASAAILAGAALGLHTLSEPKDTFDDPLLAYAEAQKAMQMIAEALDSGADKTNEAIASFERQKEILENLMK